MLQPSINPSAPAAFSIYRSADFGLVMQYPTAWQPKQDASPQLFNLLFLAPMEDPAIPFREFVVFAIQPFLLPVSLEAYEKFVVSMGQGQVQVLSSDSTTLGGIPARRLIYTGPLNAQVPLPGKSLTVLAIKDMRGYAFSFMARAQRFDYYLALAEQMIASVDIL